MKLYLIAILVALVGLWASGQVQAAEPCGLRSDRVFSVERWTAETGLGDEIYYTVTMKSTDDKTINSVGGTIEFFLDGASIASPRITLDRPVAAHAETTIHLAYAVTGDSSKLTGTGKTSVTALACVDSIDYVDGSGVIIN
jgi:hypothetical protein